MPLRPPIATAVLATFRAASPVTLTMLSSLNTALGAAGILEKRGSKTGRILVGGALATHHEAQRVKAELEVLLEEFFVQSPESSRDCRFVLTVREDRLSGQWITQIEMEPSR